MMKMRTLPTALMVLSAALLTFPATADDRGGPDRMMHGKMMKNLDLDDNGEITRDEFRSPAENRVTNLDTNGDGLVTPDELDADFEARQAEMLARSSERHARMRERFFQQDTNGDGAISADEINETLFAQMDADGSGGITRDEIRPRRKHHRLF